MPCFHPLKCYRSKSLTVNNKRSIVFNIKDSNGDTLEIPCGQCIGCRLERSRQWAVRISTEASLYEKNCFITLTFSPEHLEKRSNKWSLDVSDFQKFMKRLRKAVSPKKIRFFSCGEYGEKNMRPHYHACIFGYDFPDKILYTIRDECRLYRSPLLEKIWNLGFATVGDVTFESAAIS